jgi:pimeloyl-ACP methyl ester carboxylesterase
MLAIVNGAEKFTAIHVPVLAIFAVSPKSSGNGPTQADAFQAAIPQARVVRVENADHFIFKSNETEVFNEMNTFLDRLAH